jgi:hypothetical protein
MFKATNLGLAQRWIGFSEDDGKLTPKAQILGGKAVPHMRDQRVEDNAFQLIRFSAASERG